MKYIDLSKIHDCEKCRGKIVCITIDNVGIERCGYCGQVVPYRQFIERKLGMSMEEHLKKEMGK